MECVDMAQRTVTLISQAGLHGRPAALSWQAADGLEADRGARRTRRDTPCQSERLQPKWQPPRWPLRTTGQPRSHLRRRDATAQRLQGYQWLTKSTRTPPPACSTPTTC
jgi:hypothetical protein